jgi:hypothetical protein
MNIKTATQIFNWIKIIIKSVIKSIGDNTFGSQRQQQSLLLE